MYYVQQNSILLSKNGKEVGVFRKTMRDLREDFCASVLIIIQATDALPAGLA